MCIRDSPDGVSRSVERLAALAAGVMRKGSLCVTAPEQPKAVLSELIVAAGKCDCELVVPDPEDITLSLIHILQAGVQRYGNVA